MFDRKLNNLQGEKNNNYKQQNNLKTKTYLLPKNNKMEIVFRRAAPLLSE